MFYISKQSWNKIINYARGRVEQTGDEVGGMAVILKDEDGDYIVKEPVILKQETTGSTCTLDKEELANYYVEMAQKYGKDLNFLWWHSHAKMSAFWSGTDTNTMQEYNNGKWSAFLVVNVREEHKFSVQFWDPIEELVDVDLKVMDNKETSVPKVILDELNAKCKEETVLINGWNNRRGIINHNQMNLYGVYNQVQQNVEIPDKQLALDEVCDIVEKMLDQYVAGTMTKHKWNKEVKSTNRLLKKAKCEYRIKKLTTDELEAQIYTSWPVDLVVDEKGEAIEDNRVHGGYGWG